MKLFGTNKNFMKLNKRGWMFDDYIMIGIVTKKREILR